MSDSEDKSIESLDWDEDKKKAIIGVPPSSKYGAASENIRHAIPEARICAMFCKGKNCKYDNATPWKENQMAIKGLYSNWITSNILATARPNTQNIEKYDIINQFKQHGIASIINLQQPGEHCTCGPPLEPGGFSYKQQDFMDNDIFFYNFGWQDYGVGSLANILDMVKVMQFALSEGKVAVHCHAGLGRTGVLIACYLVFSSRIDPWEVVHYIRSKRPPSVQTRSQIICIQEFAQFIKPFRIIFSNIEPKTHDFTLPQFLLRQKHMLHGYEARKLKFVPKIIHECCERLLQLAGHGHKQSSHHDNREDVLKTAPSALNNRAPLVRSSSVLKSTSSSQGLHPLKSKSVSLESFTPQMSLKGARSSQSITSSINNSELSDSDSGPLTSRSSTMQSSSDKDLTHRNSKKLSNGSLTREEIVARAMAMTEYDEQATAAINDLKDKLNSGSGWRSLHAVTDPAVLAGLMWDWIDHLKEPVLGAQDLPDMLEFTGSPRDGLGLLYKGTQHTVEVIFKTITRLQPLSDEAEQEVVQRVLSTLTHQNMVVEMESLLAEENSLLKRTSNDTGIMRANVAHKMMFFFMHLLHVLQVEETQYQKEQRELSKRRLQEAREEQKRESSRKTMAEKEGNPLRSSFAKGKKKSFEAEDEDLYRRNPEASKSLLLDRQKMARHKVEEEDESEEEDDDSEEDTIVQGKGKGKPPQKLPPLKNGRTSLDGRP